MAMNKKELAEFEALKSESLLNRALRWSDYDETPDLSVPDSASDYVNGWSISKAGLVILTWSTAVVHGIRDEGVIVSAETRSTKPFSATQGGIKQYSSELLALKSLRRTLERSFAEKLAAIDKKIKTLNTD